MAPSAKQAPGRTRAILVFLPEHSESFVRSHREMSLMTRKILAEDELGGYFNQYSLLVQQLYHKIHWEFGTFAALIEAIVPSLEIIVRSCILEENSPFCWREHVTFDPRVGYVVDERGKSVYIGGVTAKCSEHGNDVLGWQER